MKICMVLASIQSKNVPTSFAKGFIALLVNRNLVAFAMKVNLLLYEVDIKKSLTFINETFKGISVINPP